MLPAASLLKLAMLVIFGIGFVLSPWFLYSPILFGTPQ